MDYRTFTAASAKFWHGLSNAEQAVHDRMVAQSDWCLERARRKALNDTEREEEDCTRCLERCAKYQQKSELYQKKSEHLRQRATEGPRPLGPWMVYLKRDRADVPRAIPSRRRGSFRSAGLASTQILKNLIQNLCGPRSGENFSKSE